MMQLNIIKLNKIDKVTFLNYFKNEIQNNREYELIRKLVNDCNKGKNTIYILEINNKKAAFIGVSFDRINDYPSVSVEYLFVIKSLRGKKLKNFYNKKSSEILLGYVIKEIIPKIKEYIAIKYLILYPDMQNQKLANYYLSLLANAFKLNENKETWILLKV